MTVKRVRWGILGAASINAATIPAMHASDYAEVYALASRSAARAEEAAARFNIPVAYEGYERLLADPSIDAVYIPLPNALHREWVIRAAAAGKHVLCEKPMAITASDAREMRASCDEAGVLLAEAFMYGHHPRFARIRSIVDAGELGPIRTIVTSFTFNGSDDLEHSGFQGYPGSGALYDVGCYAIHSARLLLGMEPEAVTAHALISIPHGDIDMSTAALVEFAGGVSLLLQVGMWNADADTIEIVGSEGRLVVPHAFLCGPGQGDFTVSLANGSRTESVPDVDHYRAQIDNFCLAIRTGAPLPYGPDDAALGAAVLEAATVSYRERRRVVVR